VKQDMAALTEPVEIPHDGVFVLHPGEFVLGATHERIGVPDDLVGRVEGKALAISTEIPSPDGMRTMADLRAGDRVFSDLGAPVRIRAVSEVMWTRPCREVTFSDGTVVIADASHQWVTTTRSDRRVGRKPSVRTTDEIAATLRVGNEHNHQVHLPAMVQYARQTLPVPPYAFGRRCTDGNEHVPREYLEASTEQRLALLQGLMDSGGHVDRFGRVELTSTADHLAESVRELVASLGMVATLTKGPSTRQGIDCGLRYRLRFRPDRPARTMRARSIRSVRKVPSVPVKCIEVDSPSGVFLATRAYIPTHNSSLGRLGLIIHSTAGFIDAGFDGHITLELTNIATLPITLYPGMKIGQVSFMQMTTPADKPYGKGASGSKYQGQRGPTPSRYFENFKDD
jgi:deoxycytidine triphosphate deaminase